MDKRCKKSIWKESPNVITLGVWCENEKNMILNKYRDGSEGFCEYIRWGALCFPCFYTCKIVGFQLNYYLHPAVKIRY